MGSTHAWRSTHGVDSQTVPVKKSCVPFSPLSHESTHGVDSKIKIWFSCQNILPKILKFSLVDYTSFVLVLEASESGIDEIMILPLKYNKSFSKSRSLVIPSNAL